MEETKIIEMNDEALEVAEEFVEANGVSTVGKVLIGAGVIALAGLLTYKVIKVIKEKKAAKDIPQVTEPIEVEHTEVTDDEYEEN